MKTKTVLFIMSLIIIQNCSFSQHWITENYPLGIGNVFVIKKEVTSGSGNSITFSRTTITKDSIISSRRYFLLSTYFGYTNKLWRLDTITGNLFMYDSSNSCPNYGHEKLYDSLWASLGDSSYGCGSERLGCTDTTSTLVFNEYVRFKRFYKHTSFYLGETNINKMYAKNFGVIQYTVATHLPGGFGSTGYWLVGAFIDGVLYGDTSIPIGINGTQNFIPIDFFLVQNYPNPFNPLTKINYDIPKNSIVKLTIYDILGREVIKLVNNEYKQPGRYTVEFNGTNFASGVYFYRIEAGDFKMSKKMVLVK